MLLECGQDMIKFPIPISPMSETPLARLYSRQARFVVRITLISLVAVPVILPTGLALHGQQLQTQAAPSAPPAPATALSQQAPASQTPIPGEITEDYVKQMLVGKQLFLRGGYLGDSLSFNEFGDPTGTPAIGSFTLSAVQIDQVHLTKNKLELEGTRYALHFLGAMPYEDDAKAVDRVRITPKKKTLRISIARENLDKKSKDADALKAAIARQASQNASTAASSTSDNSQSVQPAAQQPSAKQDKKQHSKEKAEESKSATAAHEAKQMHDAIQKVFAQGIDESFRAKLPDFWQLYFEAQAVGKDFRPTDPQILRSGAVDTQAKVLSSIAPQSNEFAQNNSIAGQAIYRVVIGTDGLPGQIAVVRPIGFGLDENAVAAIRKATFAPAMKAGKPVPEALDLAVLFRIYSKETAASGGDAAQAKGPAKPGPYSAGQPAQPAAAAPNQ